MSVVCSAKGCHETARWALSWNNPRLHTLERRKTWLACDAHREQLSQFLAARRFLREVEPVPDEHDEQAGGQVRENRHESGPGD